jgi:uncharacterized membrane protein
VSLGFVPVLLLAVMFGFLMIDQGDAPAVTAAIQVAGLGGGLGPASIGVACIAPRRLLHARLQTRWTV